MYKNVNTGEVSKLDHTVYVFENGERWNKELFFKNFVEVDEA